MPLLILVWILQRRFEDALKKLQADLDMKFVQRDELKEKQRLIKEGLAQEDADTEGAGEDADLEDGGGDEGLFGDEPESGMDMDMS